MAITQVSRLRGRRAYGAGGSGGPLVPDRTDKDMDIFIDIRDRLVATEHFGLNVEIGDPGELSHGAGAEPHAYITPMGWSEPASPSAFGVLRRVSWRLYLYTRQQTPFERIEALDSMRLAAANALVGKPLANRTIPGLTTIAEGSWPDDVPPNRTMVCEGSFAYRVR